jgi:ATP-binding cassette subfamily B protein
VALIAADNLLWRLACWIANPTFVAVTGDLRSELFRHLTGQAPGYFADRLPGTLASRVTATSNAVFTVENMTVLNVLPPIAATVTAIIFVATVSTAMALVLMLVAGAMVIGLFRLAAAGQPLHHDFADKAAAVDGEMVDVISNMPLVWAFCGLRGERRRFDATIAREMTARRRSLYYLERLRILHASITIILTIGLLAWSIRLWEQGAVTTGDVIMACTLGLSVLHATRDLAVASRRDATCRTTVGSTLDLARPASVARPPGSAIVRSSRRVGRAREHLVFLSRRIGSVRGFEPADRARAARRSRRPVRRWQIEPLCIDPAVL